MLDFNVTLKIVKGNYSYEEEYDLTEYSEEEKILEYMQNGINFHIEEDGGKPLSISMEDIKIIDYDFPYQLCTEDMTLSELIRTALDFQDCQDDDEIDMLIEYRDEIDDKAEIGYVRDCYMGQWRNFKDFAEEIFKETHDIPEDLEQYIDWDYVAQEVGYDYDMTDSGYVFSRQGIDMKELIQDKKQIVVIHTGTHTTVNGGIVRHYKTYVINEDNSRLYNISYIMKDIGFKVNKNSEILIHYSDNHKDMIMDKLRKYLNMDIEILSDI